MQNGGIVIRHNPSVISSVQWRELLAFAFRTLEDKDLDMCVERGFTIECDDLHAMINVLVQGWYRVTNTDTDTVPPLMLTVEPVIGPDARWEQERVNLAPRKKKPQLHEIGEGIFAMTIGDPEDIEAALNMLISKGQTKQ